MENRENKNLATVLKRYRIERDLTLQQIADLTKLGVGTIYRLENGLVEPNERTVFKLRRALPGLLELETKTA
jgi:transcriptional regulator with XRE-family HTH domain